MRTLHLRRGVTLVAGTVALVLGAALPASAHVVISPNTSTPGSFELYTVRVPNELADQATTAVEKKISQVPGICKSTIATPTVLITISPPISSNAAKSSVGMKP